MKSYKIIITLFFITSSLFGQKMWKNDYSYRHHIWGSAMKVEDAKQIVLTKQAKDVYGYDEAVRFLYEFHRDSLSQFLLDNLNTPFSSKDYGKIYTDKYFRGLLGDTTVISGMDSLTQYTGGTFKLFIVRKLTEVGIFNYYDFIKQGLQAETGRNKNIWYYTLSLYGVDPRYKIETSQILEDGIRNYVVNNVMDRTERWGIIYNLSKFDKPKAIEILEEYFHNSTGMERSVYYVDLGNLDNDGQPERAKYALLNEQDDTFRRDYIPNPTYYYRYGDESDLGFYTPSFVKFLKDLNVERGTDTYSWKISFIKAFRPVKFDSSSSLEQNIIYVNDLVDTNYNYQWLGDITFSNELKNILATAKTNLLAGDSLACRTQAKAFQDLIDNVYKDSLNTDPRFVTIEGWKFLYWNAQYILDRLPEPPTNPNLLVNLKSSTGTLLTTGSLQYYEGSWKAAVSNGDGTFTVITNQNNVSLRMTYEYGQQTVSSIPAHNNTYTFQTVNAQVQLKNSLGNLQDVGTVQYYAGAWRSFGTTTNGIAAKELLPLNYSFRMTHEFLSKDKQQNLSTNPVVEFTTVLCTVKVVHSDNQPLNNANVRYYGGAWQDLGVTNSEGITTKELLPQNISFRASYGNVSLDKQQDIGTNSLVEIQLNVP